MSGIRPVVLYVQDGCPFCGLALERLREAIEEFSDFELVVRSRRLAARCGDRVVATPTVLFPNGQRISGTPETERLSAVLCRIVGKGTSVPNKVWYLEQNRMFRGLPLKEIEKFAHLFHEYDYGPRETIFAQGDLGDAIYLLKTGHVRIYRLTEAGREITLAVLGPGDVFGELALFEEVRRETFAETLDQAHICTSSVGDFNRLMSHRPQLGAMVAREIARRRKEAETRIAGMAYGTVGGRIKFVLRHLAQEHGTKLPDGSVRIELRLGHQDLANIVGTARETCTVELGKLQRQGLVQIDEDHRLILPDPARLDLGAFDKLIKTVVGVESISTSR
jgi:CRP-like cAMP-binding protein